MSRFDKYDPVSGGFRAKLGFAPAADDVGDVIAVDINGSGNVIRSADGAACAGVICLSSLLAQGDPVDVMTDGEIVDVGADVTGAGTGVVVRAAAAGAVTNAAGTGQTIGRFIEAWRLVVRVGR